jgi:hypothetical protein
MELLIEFNCRAKILVMKRINKIFRFLNVFLLSLHSINCPFIVNFISLQHLIFLTSFQSSEVRDSRTPTILNSNETNFNLLNRLKDSTCFDPMAFDPDISLLTQLSIQKGNYLTKPKLGSLIINIYFMNKDMVIHKLRIFPTLKI